MSMLGCKTQHRHRRHKTSFDIGPLRNIHAGLQAYAATSRMNSALQAYAILRFVKDDYPS